VRRASRARTAIGTSRSTIDEFDPAGLVALGWDGEASAIGGWGNLFNGGGWFTVEGRRVDVHYRDLTVVERILAEIQEGRFQIEPLLFHQAGIPSYLLAAELANNVILHGELPRPAYPDALRRTAPVPTTRSGTRERAMPSRGASRSAPVFSAKRPASRRTRCWPPTGNG